MSAIINVQGAEREWLEQQWRNDRSAMVVNMPFVQWLLKHPQQMKAVEYQRKMYASFVKSSA